MASQTSTALVAAIATTRRITAEDVLRLRRDVFQDGVVAIQEAESLFELDAACADVSPEWTAFFVEALTDFTVHQAAPQGHVSNDNAAWLVRMISKDARVETRSELELLVKVLETARSAPSSLSAYALQQVADAVLEGKGPLAGGGMLKPGAINKDEVQLIRRILHAMSGEGGLAVSRDEAELLFTMNDRTAHDANDPAWNDLFVKAIGNYVCGFSKRVLVTRDEALRHESFLDSGTPGISGTLGGMFGSLGQIGEALRNPASLFSGSPSADKQIVDAHEAGARDAERVEAEEARWLAGKIGGDGELHENERALLKFIRDVASDIHDDLKPLMAKVA